MRLLFIAVCAVGLAGTALAHDYVAGPIRIAHPWSRPAGAGMNAAGFATVTNTGKEPVSLVAVAASGAKSAAVHQTVEKSGVFSMAAVPNLTIAPGQTVTLAPGGYHVMFVGLKAPLGQGGKLPATLTFRQGAKTVPVNVTFNVDTPKEEHKH